MRRNVPKVLVVVTDGRSQDDVKKSAEKLQHAGILCGIINNIQFNLPCIHSMDHVQQTGFNKFTFSFSHQTDVLLPECVAYLLNYFANAHSDETTCGYWMPNNSVFFFLLCVCVSGYSVFVVGVADVDITELRIIGSKPSERHVFVVDDYDAFAKIQDNLITFICETATSSKTFVKRSAEPKP